MIVPIGKKQKKVGMKYLTKRFWESSLWLLGHYSLAFFPTIPFPLTLPSSKHLIYWDCFVGFQPGYFFADHELNQGFLQYEDLGLQVLSNTLGSRSAMAVVGPQIRSWFWMWLCVKNFCVKHPKSKASSCLLLSSLLGGHPIAPSSQPTTWRTIQVETSTTLGLFSAPSALSQVITSHPSQ